MIIDSRYNVVMANITKKTLNTLVELLEGCKKKGLKWPDTVLLEGLTKNLKSLNK